MFKLTLIIFLTINYISALRNEPFIDSVKDTDGHLYTILSAYGIGKDATLDIIISQDSYPQNCEEIMKAGNNRSGIYWIQPKNSKAFRVLCEMEIWEGGWTHIQKRYDGSQNFYNEWRDYKHGFGYLNKEHWLGLERIHDLAGLEAAELLIELTGHDGKLQYAHYDYFSIGSELEGYNMTTLQGFKGDAGDALSYHLGMKFSTYDLDQDAYKDSCAQMCMGAWWYNKCSEANLNGKFINMNLPESYGGQGLHWTAFGTDSYFHPLSGSRMLVRPSKK